MARLVEWHDVHRWNAKRLRFRSAICRRRARKWLRRIPGRCQRPVLVPPANEEILVAPEQLLGNSKAQEISVARRSALRRNRRLSHAEVKSEVAGVPPEFDAKQPTRLPLQSSGSDR